jgi:putative colanic acid biosynthesis acetyltransferase WcaF
MKLHQQASIYESPWTFREKVGLFLWEYAWLLLCAWTPKPLNRWRLFWLRAFGATLHGRPFVHQRARIQIPWNLTMHDRACIGDRANLYSLGPVELHAESTVAQEVYLCTGTHDFEKTMFLMTAKITVGARAFLGARTFVCSVVTKDTPPGMICCGNPCRVVRPRRAPTAGA